MMEGGYRGQAPGETIHPGRSPMMGGSMEIQSAQEETLHPFQISEPANIKILKELGFSSPSVQYEFYFRNSGTQPEESATHPSD